MNNTSVDNLVRQQLSGAYVEKETLISARFAAGDIHLQQRRRALSLLAGPNKTNFRGRGIDFEEVRAYQAGDDIRTIDWRVTARSGEAYTKLFREERERPLLVVTDQRQGMFFGSRTCFKSVTACYLSAVIGWSALHNNDRVGGLIFGNDSHSEIRPRRSRQTLLSFINRLCHFNHSLNRNSGIALSNEQTLTQALTELRRIALPGSAIYLVSDFSGFNPEQHNKQLHQLARHCELTALFVYDPLEQQLPPPGQYLISDGKNHATINTASKKLQHSYQQQFEQRHRQLQQQLGQLGIPMIDMATTDAPLQQLLLYYGNNRKRAKTVGRSQRP